MPGSIKFDPVLYFAAVDTVWKEYLSDERLRSFLERIHATGIVVRIMNAKGVTFQVRHFNSLDVTLGASLEMMSRNAGINLALHPDCVLTSEIPGVVVEGLRSAAVRVNPTIVVLSGIPTRLGQKLVIEAWERSGFLKPKPANALRKKFAPKKKKADPDDEEVEFLDD